MFGSAYHHSLLSKYITLFATMFNDIVIERGSESKVEQFRVPISYGPREKFLSRVESNTNQGNRKTAALLPRMGFEITSITYASQRKLNTLNKLSKTKDGNRASSFMSVPYDITFNLAVMAKTMEDATRVVEQIIPYFTPEFTISAKLIDTLDEITDIPIVLNSIVPEDNYDESYEQRRTIVFNLDFTMKISFWGPVRDAKVIKFIDIRYSTQEDGAPFSRTTIQPGLTANGEPTTDIDETINYINIDPDSNWDYIVQFDVDPPEANNE